MKEKDLNLDCTRGYTQEELELADEIFAEELEKEFEARDKYLYVVAELDNQKKRYKKLLEEKEFSTKAMVISNVIEVVDDLDIAIGYEPKNETLRILKKKFMNNLESLGVKEIETKLDDCFDVDKHECVGTTDCDDEDLNNTISGIVKSGYTLDGRIIRYPKVIVRKPE